MWQTIGKDPLSSDRIQQAVLRLRMQIHPLESPPSQGGKGGYSSFRGLIPPFPTTYISFF